VTLERTYENQQCLLWVRSRRPHCKKACPLYLRKRTFGKLTIFVGARWKL
jgi:hypothetical protein